MTILEFIKYISIVVIGLLPIMNPLTTIPLYMALTQKMTAETRQRQARKACLYAFCILTIFLLLGNGIISLFGISMPGIRVAGGLIILILALRMIFSGLDSSSSVDTEPDEIKHANLDYSFSPLAMPSLAGPGSIAVIMGFGSQIPEGSHILGDAIVITGIAITIGIAYLALSSASYIEKFLGEHGMQAVTKIMGFLLTCVAVQFLASGIRDFYIEFAKM
ncbi:MarC family NAAT transporter [Methylobacillus arboreus]|uniref:MarC family NAAT transporter n=1 Tax=Methylobacillus arboreus TaxID=755170 RepID=UPI001E54D39F|nr:MarC family NAAT transporter [Methylobacillus arboreus]MCB5191224.1 MarC family NAAT transporter [Methylobacillus arboreus]